MKTIPLTRGYSAKVDDEDYERLSKFKWCAATMRAPNSIRVYAVRKMPGPKKSNLYMHRCILETEGQVDHRDTDSLNNQRYNLRPATSSQNTANGRKTHGRSKFKGVFWDPSGSGKWRARIKKNGKNYSLGRFKDEVDAAQAYNFAAEEMFGEFANLNTPIGDGNNGDHSC